MGNTVIRLQDKLESSTVEVNAARIALASTTWIGIETDRWNPAEREEEPQRAVLFCPRIPLPGYGPSDCFYQLDRVYSINSIFQACRFEDVPRGRRFVSADLQLLADRFRIPTALYDFQNYMYPDGAGARICIRRCTDFTFPSHVRFLDRLRFKRSLHRFRFDR